MAVEITHREVLNNIIRFKDKIIELHEREKPQEDPGEPFRHEYEVLVNRRDGKMRFAKRISSLEPHLSQAGKKEQRLEDWKRIYLIVERDKEGEIWFSVLDEREANLRRRDMLGIAWRILSETIETLNLLSQSLSVTQSPFPEELVVQDLSSIHLARAGSRIEDLPSWEGEISRKTAEKKLKAKPLGCYLFREAEEITLGIASRLAENEKSFVHPYVLTFVDREEKISEFLILHTAKGWLIYTDEPDLNERKVYRYQPTLKALFQSLPAQFSFLKIETPN